MLLINSNEINPSMSISKPLSTNAVIIAEQDVRLDKDMSFSCLTDSDWPYHTGHCRTDLTMLSCTANTLQITLDTSQENHTSPGLIIWKLSGQDQIQGLTLSN